MATHDWDDRFICIRCGGKRDLAVSVYCEKCRNSIKKILTKEQLAEMRERFMLGEYTPEDVQDVFERMEEADLATAKLATARVCAKCDGKGELSGYKAGNCPHCTNGVVFSDERARELLERLARAEEDSGLLDWLIKSGAHIAFGEDHCWLHWAYDPNDEEGSSINQDGHFDTPREAIRAARVKEGAAE